MSSTPIPKARDDDPEDVSWALSTAATSFARGDRAETLKWLRRAAEAASEADRDVRALELAKAAAELSPPSIPAPAASRPPPPAPSRPPPLPTPSKPPPPTRPGSKTTKSHAGAKSKADETGKRAARKSLAGEVQRNRAASAPEDETQPHEAVPSEWAERQTRPPLETRPITATEADAWPTETTDPLEDSPRYGQERTRIGGRAYNPQAKAPSRAAQALRVVLWRGADGVLRVAPQGTSVSAVTIEAMLVGLDPDVDLLAWLTPP